MTEKIDSQVVIAGLPGAGKTSLLRELVAWHAKRGAVVLVMDVNRGFGDILPSFDTYGHWHWEQRRRAAEGKPHQLAAAITGRDSEDLISNAEKLSDRLTTARESGHKAPPYVAICLDEVTYVRPMSRHYLPPAMDELLSNRRHKGIALSLLCQNFRQLHPQWKETSTELCLFRTKSKKGLIDASEQFGVEMAELKRELRPLPEKHAYLKIRAGGFVSVRQSLTM